MKAQRLFYNIWFWNAPQNLFARQCFASIHVDMGFGVWRGKILCRVIKLYTNKQWLDLQFNSIHNLIAFCDVHWASVPLSNPV